MDFLLQYNDNNFKSLSIRFNDGNDRLWYKVIEMVIISTVNYTPGSLLSLFNNVADCPGLQTTFLQKIVEQVCERLTTRDSNGNLKSEIFDSLFVNRCQKDSMTLVYSIHNDVNRMSI